MALTLNDVGKKKSSKKASESTTDQKTKTPVKKTASSNDAEPKKVRPWQTADEMEAIEDSKSEPSKKIQMQVGGMVLPAEVVEILEKVEVLKNDCLAQLPPEVNELIKNTWVKKLQVYPKIRIPMPGFFVRKERRD